MEALHVLTTVVLLVYICGTFTHCSKPRFNHFIRRHDMDNKMYEHGVLGEIQVNGKIECVALCDSHKTCDLVLFNRGSSLCKLYDHDTDTGQGTDKTGWMCWAEPATNTSTTATTTTSTTTLPTTTSPATSTTSKAGPPGYIYETRLGCYYKVHADRKSWYGAKDVCHGEGGVLATPNTAAQRKFYLGLVDSGVITHDVFMGAHNKSGKWKWLDGTRTAGFTIRKEWRPNRCLELDSSNRSFDSEDCPDIQMFVCEYHGS